ncbi:beta-ketoacyl synthase N-terminal-like domain-containing protein [Saccharothrix sp. NRRL B-16314]|uniref:beta-ketoacyl synthase N-terminal-like domain-containing protein n=1 Tax=Saccharothrix sp. NRRL B-16314 TaxID=1463825 RepID=UPI0005250F00|nr:beta-ketoacyl synthase N-terminal-like domain-containing protein [Saccharothrix sp. NRRL B-16314]
MKSAITGVGLAVPGDASPADLLEPASAGASAVDPAARLGRKGLRYKDRATQLGLCAADEALRAAGLWDLDLDPGERLTVPGDSVAVVVSSNLGNIDTVCRVAQTIGDEGSRATSPMDTPNASSNILASEVAIRFGLRGPNLMVCNGATSGLDAVHWASTVLRGGRAEYVVVLGVEPDNEVVRQLTDAGRVLDGAAAVVLENPEHARGRGVTVHAEVGRYARTSGMAACADRLSSGDTPHVWFTPEGTGIRPEALAGAVRLDISGRRGLCSGALGVLQCAAAVAWFAQGGEGPVMALAGNDSDDATAGVLLYAGVTGD